MTPCTPDREGTRMSAYSKWTARVALAALGFALAVVVAMLPVAEATLRHPNRVWPIPRSWEAHHVLAGIEMLLVWAAVVLCGLALVAVTVSRLAVRAGWSDR